MFANRSPASDTDPNDFMKTLFAIIISIISTLLAQAQTSKDIPKLKDTLERFPEADTNGDGVLTMEEAKAFKKEKKSDEPVKKDAAHRNGIRSSYIYKTEGKDKYYELTIAETDKFLTGLGWLAKKPELP